MKSCSFVSRASVVVVLGLLVSFFANAAPNKPIRLRNQIFSANSSNLSSANQHTAVTGLFVIQFREAPKPEWRQQLRSLGVQLLRFVPDDAYVARFEGVKLS